MAKRQKKRRRLWLNDGLAIRLDQNIRTMFGAMTSWRIRHMTEGSLGS